MSEVYEPPAWAAAPRPDVSLEVLKGGVIVQNLRFSDQDHYVIGRVPSSDFHFEHPSISRQHAVLQFGDGGSLHVFDFGSTHGTFVNKLRIKPKVMSLSPLLCDMCQTSPCVHILVLALHQQLHNVTQKCIAF
jgi:pSer/pThr/pTyr-binding forkhead associated (FHA) protein